MIHVNGAGFCDDQMPVLSTIGRGPKGEQGDRGPKGDVSTPIFSDPIEWSIDNQYQPSTIVLHDGDSYTSKKLVPIGISIDNEEYWAHTGDYNAQVEQYREEVLQYADVMNEFGKPEYLLETFDGETFEDKLFNALDTITEGRIVCGTTINITREYQAKSKDYRNITISGAILNLLVSGFYDATNAAACSMFNLSDCVIYGNSYTMVKSGTEIVCGRFVNCTFNNVQFFNDATQYVQSLYLVGCNLDSVANFVMANQMYDFKMTSTRVESGGGKLFVIGQGGISQGSVDNCLIEGRTDDIFTSGAFLIFSITNSYFEANYGFLINQTENTANAMFTIDNCAWFNSNIVQNNNHFVHVTSSAQTGFKIGMIYWNVNSSITDPTICNIAYPSNTQLLNQFANGPMRFNTFRKSLGLRKKIDNFESTPTWDSSDSTWNFSFYINGEFYSNAAPFYVFFTAPFGSSTAYQGFVIVRLTPRTGIFDGVLKAHVDAEVIDGANHGAAVKNFDGSVTVTLDNDSYSSAPTQVNVKISGFSNQRTPEVHVVDVRALLGIHWV